MDRVAPRTLVITPSIAWLAHLPHTLRLWQQRARSRRQLAQLYARLLADAGISPSERQEELRRPYWR